MASLQRFQPLLNKQLGRIKNHPECITSGKILLQALQNSLKIRPKHDFLAIRNTEEAICRK